MEMNRPPEISIRPAAEPDAPIILSFIKELAAYEKLAHEVKADEGAVRQTLFGPHPAAEVIIAYDEEEPVGFALFFHNYSTFLARPGIYLEDLFVRPAARGRGIGTALLAYLARLARERHCGRLEWSVLDWNQSAIEFYCKLGAQPLSEWTTFRLSGKALDDLA